MFASISAQVGQLTILPEPIAARDMDTLNYVPEYSIITGKNNIESRTMIWPINTLRPRQDGRHCADDIFK